MGSCQHQVALYYFDLILCFHRYRPPLATDKPGDEEIAAKMLELAEQTNLLKEDALNGRLRARIRRGWKKIDGQDRVLHFPRMSQDDIRALTFGVYQLNQARRYAEEHLKDGTYEVNLFTF